MGKLKHAGRVAAELAHHLVAHPLWGLAIAVRRAAQLAEVAGEQLHDATARWAWPKKP
jgi:hypothetical protein